MNLDVILAPLFSLILLVLSNGFFTTFIALSVDHILISADATTKATAIGLMQAAFAAGLIIGAMTIEKLIIRIGHIRAFAVFASTNCMTILLQALFQDPLAWAGLRFISGLSMAAFYLILESWLLAASTINNRGQILALYMTVFYIAQAFSQFILEAVHFNSLDAFVISALLGCSSVIPVAISHKPAPPLHEQVKSSLSYYFKTAPYGCFSCISSGMALSVVYAFMPIFAQSTPIKVATAMFLVITGGFLLQYPIGYLSDIIGRHKTLLVSGFMLIIPAILIIIYNNNPITLMLLFFFLGGFVFVLYPLSIGAVCDAIDQKNLLNATAVLSLAYGIGSVIGPIIAPIYIAFFGGDIAIFYYLTTIGLLVGLAGILL